MGNFSILTNSGAYVALANLGGIQSALGQVQKRVSTGLQVADASDNAAVFAVAQGIRANLQQYNALNTGLNDAQALVQTALAAATSVSNLLPQITTILTQLADGSLSDQQRVVYTANLKSQVDEVQSTLIAASYNGINVVSSNQSIPVSVHAGRWYTPSGATNYGSISSISILSGIAGNLLNVNPIDLNGGSNGTDGWLGLARLSYLVAAVGNFQNSTVDYATNPNAFATPDFVSRSEILQNEAVAALAAISNSNSAYFTDPNAISGVPSVFGASIANFSQQVNTALSVLGASANNIQLQLTFNQSIADSLTTGLGNLVDANLAKQSAQLTALQTQQQLAVQSLSIANAAPKTILSLFK